MTREELCAQLLSTREILDALRISYGTLRDWRDRGHLLPILVTSNACIYWRDDVKRLRATPFYLRYIRRGRRRKKVAAQYAASLKANNSRPLEGAQAA